jgi:uncharacterized spore protein YtfJ
MVMGMVENLTKTTLEEIERVLTTRTVVGDPITVEGRTLIPLISVGFGFGAGGGSGKGETKQKGEGEGGGTGGGAWVRPIAIIVMDKDGVRVEPIRRGLSTTIDKISEAIPKVVDKFIEKREERKKEG